MEPIDQALADARAENTRTDTKAGALLSGGGILAAALGIVTGGGHGEPVSVTVAAVLLAAALVASALVIRPRLSGAARGSFTYWATLDRRAIRNAVAEDHRDEQLEFMSQLVVTKMSQLRIATDLTVAAVVALLVAAALAA
ncbi:Pycsar system effector family protein [Kitasatospora sp. NPDC059646]|uniref:Pycsar system effector family protein n=1 Tax=Kitasatospora sp. NPDC059646 TaxID=3346893 RepID=UPI003686CD45